MIETVGARIQMWNSFCFMMMTKRQNDIRQKRKQGRQNLEDRIARLEAATHNAACHTFNGLLSKRLDMRTTLRLAFLVRDRNDRQGCQSAGLRPAFLVQVTQGSALKRCQGESDHNQVERLHQMK